MRAFLRQLILVLIGGTIRFIIIILLLLLIILTSKENFRSKSRNFPAPPPSVLFNNETICDDFVAHPVVNTQMVADTVIDTFLDVLANDLAFGTDLTYLDDTTLFDMNTMKKTSKTMI